jgi:DNA-binding CsgD family transcriptional regulator
LLGREHERGRITHLVERAREGHGGALLVLGGPGTGKSTLCTDALESAAGITKLTTVGLASESGLPFAGLFDLLRPLQPAIDRLPAPQADALAGALALRSATPSDRFAVFVGLLGLLSAAADDAPVLLVVDDLHWVDRSSLDALLFVARRLHDDRVAMLLSARPVELTADTSRIDTIELHGLDVDASVELLRGASGVAVAPETGARLHELTDGNPLVLVELAHRLSASELSGRLPLPEPLPAAAAAESLFESALAGLAGSSFDALVIAAAASADQSDTDHLTAALKHAHLDIGDLTPSVAADLLLEHGDTFEFRHPLVRSAVRQRANDAVWRKAHATLAATSTDDDARARHLAEAAGGPDEPIASEVEAAGRRAAARMDHASAATFFERAASLSPDRDQQARRKREAARSRSLLGDIDEAARLLTEAIDLTHDQRLQLELRQQRAGTLAWSGEPHLVLQDLLGVAEEIGDTDPAFKVAVMLDALIPAVSSGDIPAAARISETTLGLARSLGPPVSNFAALAFAGTYLLIGRRDEALDLFQEGEVPPLDVFPPDMAAQLSVIVGIAQVWAEDLVLAETIVRAAIAHCRTSNAPAALPAPLAMLALVLHRSGPWDEALAVAHEAIALAEETRQPGVLANAYASLVRVLAATGDHAGCVEHYPAAIAAADRVGASPQKTFVEAAMGHLFLSEGDLPAAIATLDRAAALSEAHGVGDPIVLLSGPDHIEALTRAGRSEHARERLATFAGAPETKFSRSAAQRCRGLLERDPLLLVDAMTGATEAGYPLDAARAEMILAEVLRARGRAAEAEPHLQQAIAAFDTLGARQWSRHARDLMGASADEVPRRRGPTDLTPQELQVALLVGRGATNREAATALFVSVKTIEFHLGSIYRKLQLRSRTELALRVAAGSLIN